MSPTPGCFMLLCSFAEVRTGRVYAAAATFLRVLAAMTSRLLMATLTRAEAGEPPPVIARVRLSAASTRPMTAKTKAG